MKLTIKIFALAALLAVSPAVNVLAESSSEASSTSASSESSASNESSQAEVVGPEVGTRKAPVPLGKTKEVKESVFGTSKTFEATYKLRVNHVLRGESAERVLTKVSRYNQTALADLKSNQEVLLAEIELEYVEGDEQNAYQTPYRVQLFDDKGKEVRVDAFYPEIPDDEEFTGVELFPGASHKGYVALVVPKGMNVQLAFDSDNGKVFFSTTK